MYCHFFCVANNTELLREDDTAYTGFKPLALSNALSADGTGIGLRRRRKPHRRRISSICYLHP